MQFDPQFTAKKLQGDFKLTPVVSTEIEFYVLGAQDAGHERASILGRVHEVAAAAGLTLARADAEVGQDQYEVSFAPGLDVATAAQQTEHFKFAVTEVFKALGLRVDFGARPVAGQPGSGLHVHMHLQDEAGVNRFTRAGDEMNSPFSDELLHSLGGMLALMNPCMKIFAPHESSFERFVPKANAPLTVSWGTNNRTVALRLPSKALDNKHIEHRVAGSDADVASVIWAVLSGAHFGLLHRRSPGEPIYGDASLPQYRLPLLARSPDEAELYYGASRELAPYMQS